MVDVSFAPLICLIAGIGCILFLILYLRVHAFVALITSALLVALLTALMSDDFAFTDAVPLVTTKFGEMMAGIGILLVLASIIGKAIMDSGAADRIVRAFTRMFGKGREKYALLFSGFVLSIPVFFDTVYYLLAPLGRSVYSRTKKDYALIIACVAGGGAITHALVPPTPGPILVAEELGVSIGLTIMVGIVAALVPMFIGVGYASIVNRFMQVIPSEVIGVTDEEIEAMAEKPDSALPSLWFSLVPFVLPVFLLAGYSFLSLYTPEEVKELWVGMIGNEGFAQICANIHAGLLGLFAVIGDKNVAFFIGAAIAVYLVVSSLKITFQSTFERFEPAITSGAIIAFITCAGGAFGKTLQAAGIGEFIKVQSETWGIPILVLAYLTATLIRVAQGSATAAMVITAGIIASILPVLETPLPYHPVYLISVIGFGATGFSWMNDSGFWIFCRMSGITVKQTLIIWTGMLTVISISGFGWVYLLTKIWPMAG